MFKKSSSQAPPKPKVERAERIERREQSFLQSGAKLQGDLTVEGDLRIEGRSVGNLKITGLLTVGSRAEVEGTLEGREIIVHGKVHGSIQAEERIHLARGAKVSSDLYCKALMIEDGVFFEGRSHMGEPLPRTGAAEPPRQGAEQAASGGTAKGGGADGAASKERAARHPEAPASGPQRTPSQGAGISRPADRSGVASGSAVRGAPPNSRPQSGAPPSREANRSPNPERR